MSGQPNRGPRDAQKFREQYLANLDLQVKLQNKNYEANKIYKRTGQTPSIMQDTRTLDEKLADLYRLKIDLRSELRLITDGPNAEDIVNNLSNGEIQFLASHIKEIIDILKPKYKFGIPSLLFIDYLRHYIDKVAKNYYVGTGLQQTHGADVLLSINQIKKNMVDKNTFKEIYDKIMEHNRIISELNRRDLQRSILQLSRYLPTPEQLEDIAQCRDQVIKSQLEEIISNIYKDLPTREELKKLIVELGVADARNDREQAQIIMEQINQVLSVESSTIENMAAIQQLLEQNKQQLTGINTSLITISSDVGNIGSSIQTIDNTLSSISDNLPSKELLDSIKATMTDLLIDKGLTGGAIKSLSDNIELRLEQLSENDIKMIDQKIESFVDKLMEKLESQATKGPIDLNEAINKSLQDILSGIKRIEEKPVTLSKENMNDLMNFLAKERMMDRAQANDLIRNIEQKISQLSPEVQASIKKNQDEFNKSIIESLDKSAALNRTVVGLAVDKAVKDIKADIGSYSTATRGQIQQLQATFKEELQQNGMNKEKIEALLDAIGQIMKDNNNNGEVLNAIEESRQQISDDISGSGTVTITAIKNYIEAIVNERIRAPQLTQEKPGTEGRYLPPDLVYASSTIMTPAQAMPDEGGGGGGGYPQATPLMGYPGINIDPQTGETVAEEPSGAVQEAQQAIQEMQRATRPGAAAAAEPQPAEPQQPFKLGLPQENIKILNKVYKPSNDDFFNIELLTKGSPVQKQGIIKDRIKYYFDGFNNNPKSLGDLPTTNIKIYSLLLMTVPEFMKLIDSNKSSLANINYKEAVKLLNIVNNKIEEILNKPLTTLPLYDEKLNKISGSGFRMKGKGIMPKYNADYNSGIEETKKYIPLGRFYIDNIRLNNDILALKRGNGVNVAGFPIQRVSKDMGNVLRSIVSGANPKYEHLEKLTPDEKNYLYKLAKHSNIIDRISIPAPNKDSDEKDINQFEIMKGEILSGNDNIELIKKFKLLLVKLSNKGLLPKTEVREMLMGLATLGY